MVPHRKARHCILDHSALKVEHNTIGHLFFRVSISADSGEQNVTVSVSVRVRVDESGANTLDCAVIGAEDLKGETRTAFRMILSATLGD